MTPIRRGWQERQLKPLVVVNLDANGGKGGRRWERISGKLRSILPVETKYLLYHPPFPLETTLDEHVRKDGFNCIVSAGGDGTVNLVLNILMNNRGVETENCFLGGIGLGSSNDFLKPVDTVIDSVPCRIRTEKSVLADVGKVTYTREDGESRTQYFIVNSSLGITAEANFTFNRGSQPVSFLKPRMLGAAILYSAVRAILTFENIPVSLSVEQSGQAPQGPLELSLSNLTVLKNPHVSGGFVYDQDIRADDGCLGLNYCSGMNKWELLNTLWDLSRGRFSGKAKRFSLAVTKAQVLPDQWIALELDGEVVRAKGIRFALSRRKINLLG